MKNVKIEKEGRLGMKEAHAEARFPAPAVVGGRGVLTVLLNGREREREMMRMWRFIMG